MPKNMKKPMTSALFLATANLALVGLIAINGAQARTLPDSLGLKVAIRANYGRSYPSPIPSPRSQDIITITYEKYSSPPPQSLKADPSGGQVTPSFGRTMASPPPPPKPAPPKSQLEIGSPCTEGIPCNNGCFSMTTNFERPVPSSPPSPKPESPTAQITFDLDPKAHARSPPAGQFVFST
ncbi:hypothetical protein SADUNF_Sadunf03G0142700 [Salix dunnii]|uniref:Uncharacterized protein n=1 Tax=Salix dunnii TaxID=1413687 RepID=A0A835THE7_9ROSI|nr:hypothetical protein SADUNF_Sadunf03G0142700 [Salix dunnii]